MQTPPAIKAVSLRPLLCLLLLPVLLFGCAGKGAENSLLDDPAFVAELEACGNYGLHGITVVAPASGPLSSGTLKTYANAERLGVNFPAAAINPEHIPYNANNDATRLELFKEALTNPQTEVIWAMRGGYGSSRILAGLDALPPQAPKIFIGYSDMTFLHSLLQQWGWKTIHGSMFFELNSTRNDPENFRLLAGILSGRLSELSYSGLTPFNETAKKLNAPVTSTLTGGNLTCLASATGTPWAAVTAGKILFVEDVKEAGYKIDRMFTQLTSASMLDDVAAVIIGSFSLGDKNTEFALQRFAAELKKPVFRTDQFGHGSKNYPLVFGAPASLNKTADGSYTLHISLEQLP